MFLNIKRKLSSSLSKPLQRGEGLESTPVLCNEPDRFEEAKEILSTHYN